MTTHDPAALLGTLMLERARIVMLGYDEEARTHALALRHAGNHVVIAAQPGSLAWDRASDDGFMVGEVSTVVPSAEVVVVREHADTAQWRSCENWIAGGALVVFGSAQALHSGRCARSGMDVVLVTNIEDAVIGCRLGVHRDVSRRALLRACAYARAVYSADAVMRTTFICDEAEREMAAGRDRTDSMLALTAKPSLPRAPWNADDEAEPADLDDAGWFYGMMNRRGM
jgi:ketol-acid reductoisomerase